MKTYVISLRRSRDRRKNIITQMDSLGIEYCFFDAIDASESREKYFRHYDQERYFLSCGRSATSGEVGCYASHLGVWKASVASGSPIVVLEDDAQLDERYESAINFVEKHINDLGFIRLEKNWKPGAPRIVDTSHHSIRRCKKYPFSAMAYAISPAVAQVFIEYSKVLSAPVDKFIKDFWVHQQPLYDLSPPAVRENELGLESTIRGRRKSRYSLRGRCARMHRKGIDAILRLAFNIRFSAGRFPTTGAAAMGEKTAIRYSGTREYLPKMASRN